ncbi:MAG: GyrI-like domain-containing protein [Eubacteriales bacterium]|nr:GyrI-like domain-containing protein [Eubacteriales bacterium]
MEPQFEFLMEYKELYQPKTVPEIIDVPEMTFFAVDGHGNPNDEDGEYKSAVGLLYALSYTVKMSQKSGTDLSGFFPYKVAPLEGFWQMAEGVPGVDYGNKDAFEWTSVIRQPAFVDERVFDWACEQVRKKKGVDASRARLWRYREGLCAQMMHIGPYDAEPASVEQMDAFLAENGYRNDLGLRRHHEIYLGDPLRTKPDKLKTILRHPVAKS